MRIDVHAHYWTDDYLDLMAELGKTDTGTQRGTGAGGGAELDARLKLMDRARVDMQVLSAAPQLPYGSGPGQALAAARFVNDQYAELVSRHRELFRAFAATPMPHVGESIGEMGRALDELGMAGVVMNTTILDQALADPRFEPSLRRSCRPAAGTRARKGTCRSCPSSGSPGGSAATLPSSLVATSAMPSTLATSPPSSAGCSARTGGGRRRRPCRAARAGDAERDATSAASALPPSRATASFELLRRTIACGKH